MEERRFLLECLNASKKKSIKEIVKKLHDMDRPGGTLEKAIAYFYQKVQTEFKDRFNTWRMVHFGGGFLSEMGNSPTSRSKDPILE